MSILEAIILGLIQGLTEFIPVSSSGHLLLLHEAFDLQAGGLAFDVALHIGTLAALLAFFYRDVLDLIKQGLQGGPRRRLAWILALATVPAVIVGMLLQETAETTFRSPGLVAGALSALAILMIVAERYTQRRRQHTALEKVSWWQGLLVGCAQAVALVPGVSRSGSTITAGLFAGIDRVAATRFSFLLSIPITLGAIIKVMTSSDTLEQISAAPGVFAVGIVTAAISGALAIRFLLKFVAKHSLEVFAYYRLILAAIVFLLLVAF